MRNFFSVLISLSIGLVLLGYQAALGISEINLTSIESKEKSANLSPIEEFTEELNRIKNQYQQHLAEIDSSRDSNEFDSAYHKLKGFFAFPGQHQFSNLALCSFLESKNNKELLDLENILTSSDVKISLKTCLARLRLRMDNYLAMTRVSTVLSSQKIKKVAFETRRVPNLSYLSFQGLNDKEVMLTFDDGPTPSVTASILNSLDQAGVKAAFFSTGIQAQGNRDLVKEILNRGHLLGSHSYTHTLMMGREVNRGNISYDYFLAELIGGHLGVYFAGGFIDPYFRFPNGCMNQNMRTNVEEIGLKIFGWNIDTFDWQFSPRKYPDPAQRAEAVLKSFITSLESNRNRGIVLMHDIGIQSAEALPLILNFLADNNFKVVLLEPEDREEQWAKGHMPLVTQALKYIRQVGVKFADLLPPNPIASDKVKHPNFVANTNFREMFPQLTYENSPIDPLTNSCRK